MTAPLLLVTDTPALQAMYRSLLVGAGHDPRFATSATEATGVLADCGARVVLLDLTLPDRENLDLLAQLLAIRAEAQIILVSANTSISRAVAAMRAGAFDVILRPFDDARLLAAVDSALSGHLRRAQPPVTAPPPPSTALPSSTAFIGGSEAMARIHGMIRSVARSMATVFITGESGTGKELCALAVHGNSARANGPFIALNCGAIPQDLLESEVFGHVKGSFTGAIADKPGAATAADGGTLFLDEICEMAPALQTKLLRFLQTSTVQPVGATRPRKVNVRIICATNRDPLDAVNRGQFREDLYYRLFVVPIHMPPLRDRGDDVIQIAEAALARFAAEEGRQFDGLSPAVAALFRRLRWPGNVRQVLNVIRHVVVLHEGGSVTLDMLPETLLAEDGHPKDAPLPEPPSPSLTGLVGKPLSEIERIVIEATLQRHGGSVPKAARVLDLSPSTLYRKIDGWKGR